MKNMKLRKMLMLVMCAMALVAISVGATLAYLTDSEGVTNTFTVGQVGIKLDEAKVDANGKEISGDGAERVYSNEYHLIPGKTYDKDPTITVETGSEDCYIVAKIVVTGGEQLNNLIKYTETDGTEYIGFNHIVTGGIFNDETLEYKTELTYTGVTEGWDGSDVVLTQSYDANKKEFTFYVYYKNATEAGTKHVLFEHLVIPGAWTNADIAALEGMQINITAYAMQEAGFGNVFDAFAEGNASGWTEKYEIPANLKD